LAVLVVLALAHRLDRMRMTEIVEAGFGDTGSTLRDQGPPQILEPL